MKRGQSAMEFLMTYGWAILVVLIVLSGLFYLGVFSPKISSTCLIEAPFICKDIKIADNGVLLYLKQNNVETYTVTDMKINGESCEELFNNEDVTFSEQEVYCILSNDLDRNAKASITFDVSYNTKSGLNHNIVGEGNGQNENELMMVNELVEPNKVIFVDENEDYSCKVLLDSFPDLEDGNYIIDPDGEGVVSPFEVYCDMVNGGWTLIYHGLCTSAARVDRTTGNIIEVSGGIEFDDMKIDAVNWDYSGTRTTTETAKLELTFSGYFEWLFSQPDDPRPDDPLPDVKFHSVDDGEQDVQFISLGYMLQGYNNGWRRILPPFYVHDSQDDYMYLGSLSGTGINYEDWYDYGGGGNPRYNTQMNRNTPEESGLGLTPIEFQTIKVWVR